MDTENQALMETEAEQPVRRKHRGWVALLILCILAAVGVATGKYIVPGLQYARAVESMEQGDYAEAYKQFKELGAYKDAERLAAESKNWRDYQKAEELFSTGDYQYAAEAFVSLGDFHDAAERAEEAEQYVRTEQQYEAAKTCFVYGDLPGAYELLTQLEAPDFPGAPELMRKVLDQVFQLCKTELESGNRLSAMLWLEFLESAGYGPALGLRSQLTVPLEPDTSYYDSLPGNIRPLETFNSQTTNIEFAHTFLDMFLTGDTRRTLPAKNDVWANSRQDVSRFRDTWVSGYAMADDWLPEYGSIYLADFDWEWNGERLLSLTLISDVRQEYTEEELRAHVKTAEEFCLESVLALNAAGLLDKTMTYKERARVIYDWVCYYLIYDHTLKIHDVCVAIEEGTGVCESYVAIYNRMCNLAGVPTYGQSGRAGLGEDTGGHVWTIQLDETGTVFYTDATFGDHINVPFRDGAAEAACVEDFLDCYGFYDMHNLSEYEDGTLREQGRFSGWRWTEDNYFWQTTLWNTHKAKHSAREIIDKFPGKTEK